MSQPRVILLCGSTLALPALQEMFFFGQLAAVIIPADCEDIIGHARSALQGGNIPVLTVTKETNNDVLAEAIEKYEANTGIIISYGYIIPATVYTKPVNGFYNIHPGPLPEYRGADPVFQQIKNKEKKATATLHRVTDKTDAGPVVMRETITLLANDTYGMLNSKLGIVAAKLVRSLLKLIQFDLAVPSRPQDESKARYYKKQGADEIMIDWEKMDATAIIALINACNPWNKGAVTKLNNKIIRLLEGEIGNKNSSAGTVAAGTITEFNEQGMFVAAAHNQIVCIKIIYSDEGFLYAFRLNELGILAGNRFQNV